MGTQLIFLVGTNALPLKVSWEHLRDRLKQPIWVRLVYTENTRDEAERLQTEITGADWLPMIKTSPGNPEIVRNDIRAVFDNQSLDMTDIHIHYTGGTKVMSVETIATIERYCQDQKERDKVILIDTSYLDPRAKSGPALVNRQGKQLVSDTRKEIVPDIRQIASLNGFDVALFTHEYYNSKQRQWASKDSYVRT